MTSNRLIMLERRRTSRSGIYYTVSEQLGLVVGVLDVGEVGRCKDLSSFGKDQIVMRYFFFWGGGGVPQSAMVST